MSEWIKGDEFGLEFPTSPEALQTGGAEFLTKALQATGILSAENAVTKLLDFTEVVAGGMGRKASFCVAYAKPEPHLHTQLFAKFEIDEANPLHDIYAGIMRSEIHFALLSRNKNFPIKVPACYFADLNEDKRKGVLITEAIPFDNGTIEPGIEKGKDYELDNPISYYQAVAEAMGTLAAHHFNGEIPSHIANKLVPRIGKPNVTELSLGELIERTQNLVDFINRNNWCFKEDVWNDVVAADLIKWLPRAAKGFDTLVEYLASDPAMNGITHWNANLDNAWFWTNPNGELEVGLLDWGNVGPINLGMAYTTMMICAETEFLEAHEEDVIEALLKSYETQTGLSLNRQDFSDSLNVGLVISGIDMTLELPNLITSSHPDFESYDNKMDPRLIEGDFLGRVLTRCLLVYLSHWKRRGVAQTISKVLS